jgi:hypothetical protein
VVLGAVTQMPPQWLPNVWAVLLSACVRDLHTGWGAVLCSVQPHRTGLLASCAWLSGC